MCCARWSTLASDGFARSTPEPSRILLADGTERRGAINGVVVLKTVEKKAVEGKTTYSISFNLVNGETIAAIDASGVHLRGGRTHALYSMPPAKLRRSDQEILDTARKYQNQPGFSGFFMMRFDNGDGVAIVTGKAEGTALRHRVVGTLRVAAGGDPRDGDLEPHLVVEEPSGRVLQIPVGQLAKLTSSKHTAAD